MTASGACRRSPYETGFGIGPDLILDGLDRMRTVGDNIRPANLLIAWEP